MRVVVLSSAFPSRTRPTYGVFVRERVRRVAERCDVVVVAPVPWFPLNRRLRGAAVADTPGRETQDGLTVHHPRFLCVPGVAKTLDGVLYALSLGPVLARLRRRFPFELIDAHFTYPDGVGAALLATAFGCPSVITLRGTHDLRHAGFALRRRQIRSALRAATRVIAVSESLRRFAVGLGLAEERVRVIPNGVDGARFLPSDRAAARERLGLPRDRVILLAVGALIEGKGHHRVVDVLPDLVARRRELLYVVVGPEMPGDEHRAFLEARVRAQGLEEHVRIVGARPHDEVPLWMAAADLFCLATRGEGWCNAIMEALACGLPVVTTRVGGNAELVGEGRDGLLVPFGDGPALAAAVLRALASPWDRAAIATRARANSWERAADAVLEEFAEAIRPAGAELALGAGRPSRP